MTDTQLYLAVGIPLVLNGAMLALINSNMNARVSSLDARLLSFENSVNNRIELLTGKVAEFSDRLARLEERMEKH